MIRFQFHMRRNKSVYFSHRDNRFRFGNWLLNERMFFIRITASLQAMFNFSEIGLASIRFQRTFNQTNMQIQQWWNGITFSGASALAQLWLSKNWCVWYKLCKRVSHHRECDYDIWLHSYRTISENSIPNSIAKLCKLNRSNSLHTQHHR